VGPRLRGEDEKGLRRETVGINPFVSSEIETPRAYVSTSLDTNGDGNQCFPQYAGTDGLLAVSQVLQVLLFDIAQDRADFVGLTQLSDDAQLAARRGLDFVGRFVGLQRIER